MLHRTTPKTCSVTRAGHKGPHGARCPFSEIPETGTSADRVRGWGWGEWDVPARGHRAVFRGGVDKNILELAVMIAQLCEYGENY